MDLFERAADETRSQRAPLPERVRPTTLAEFVGQDHLVGPGRPLRAYADRRQPFSFVLHGPPGTGKTTLAQLFARAVDAQFVPLSAVLAGVKELREAVENARQEQAQRNRATVLFIDELHRFNTAQQDALLPHVERGVVFLIGATTERPSISLNPALLSRLVTYEMRPLDVGTLVAIMQRAQTHSSRPPEAALFAPPTLTAIANAVGGDARRALVLLEVAQTTLREPIAAEALTELLRSAPVRHDARGDAHFDVISALIKTMRASDPEAALYWLARLVAGGEDLKFIGRRLMIFAAEDIGDADPRALPLARSAAESAERVGLPEAGLIFSHAVSFLARATKSNHALVSWRAAMELVEKHGALPVPPHLTNRAESDRPGTATSNLPAALAPGSRAGR